MTDQRQRFAPFSTPQRTQVLHQQSWQPPPPPQGAWQPAQSWPYQPHPQSPPQQHWQAQQDWQPQWQPAAQLPGPSSEEKTGALGAFLGAFFMPVVLPLLVMLTATNKPFQRAAALQALIVQLATLVLMMLAPFLMLALVMGGRGGGGAIMGLGYLPILLVWLFSVGFAVLGMAAAQQGKIQYAPLIGRRLAKTFRAEWHA